MSTNSPYERERLERADLPGTAEAGAGRGVAYDPVTHTARTTNPDDGPDARDRSLASLLKELRDEGTTLMRQEMALAKTEMSEKIAKAARNAASIAIGGVVILLGGLILLLGLTVALYFGLVALGMSHTWAGLVSFLGVGLLLAGVGYGMVQKGISTLKRESLVPEKTVQSLTEDKQWLSNQTTR
jgi:hypothetical protein